MSGRREALASAGAPAESVVLIAGLWVIMCAGLHYSFATYSEDLRSRLRISQQHLEVLALGKDLGAYMGFAQGAFYDAFGPRRTVAVGACLHAAGYSGLWALVGRASRPGAAPTPLWQPFICLLVASNGAGWLDMGVLMTILHNAGAERALASGVSKSLLGLGAAVFSCVYVSYLKPDARAYMLLCALAPLCIAFCAVPFLVRLPREELHLARRSPARAARLYGLGCWVALLCAYLLAANAATQGDPSPAVRFRATSGLLLLLVLPPLLLTLVSVRGVVAAVVPPGAAGAALGAPSEQRDALADAAASPDAEDGAPPDAATASAAHAPGSPQAQALAGSAPPKLRGQRSAELTVAACLRCPEFWLMFTALACGGGAAVTLINNLSQLTAALHSPVGPESFVALLSVCNAAGRLLQGALSDWVGRLGTPPPTFLVGGLMVLSMTQLALTRASPASLHVCVALTGLCFGSFWSFAPVACGELFGEKHAGTIYGFIGTAPALGSFLLNTLLAGYVYDAHVRLSPPPPPGAPPSAAPRCVGHQCFALTFRVGAAACTAGALCAYVLLLRTRHMYVRKAHT